MGSIISAIGRGINAIIGAIVGVLMTIVSVITTILVTIFDFIVDIICCRCGSGRRKAGTRRGWGSKKRGSRTNNRQHIF